MSDEYGLPSASSTSVPTANTSTVTPTAAPNRPSDTISFFALAFIASTLAYWLLLRGDTFETAFMYGLGAGVLGAAVGVLVVLTNRFIESFSDWVFRLLPWAAGMCVLVVFLGDRIK